MLRVLLTIVALLCAMPVFAEDAYPVRPANLLFAKHGQQAVTATATALPDHSGVKVVCVKVLDGGTQNVFYGNSSSVTTSNGMQLVVAQAQGMCRPVENSNQIFVIATSTGSTVAYEVWR